MTIDRLPPTFVRPAMQRSDAAAEESRADRVASQHDSRSSPGVEGRAAKHDQKVLRQQIAAIMREGGGDADPATLRPRMIRAVLLWEFGPQIREHVDWREMVDALDRAMQDDPGLEIEFKHLIATMRR
jgi:hypothetical protein